MELKEGEEILFQEGGSHYHNFVAVGGTLTLTNRALHFESCPGARYPHHHSIDLKSITGAEFFKTMFITPNGLALMLSDGGMENYIVDDRAGWKNRILQTVEKVQLVIK
ncbi:MAG: hypothetical protein RLZZ262_2592 [Bacteroidota bacterium]|jgi:hypothetical protein